jgi:hypothetical protein
MSDRIGIPATASLIQINQTTAHETRWLGLTWIKAYTGASEMMRA